MTDPESPAEQKLSGSTSSGFTKRERIALEVLKELIKNRNNRLDEDTRMAVQYADQLIKNLNR